MTEHEASCLPAKNTKPTNPSTVRWWGLDTCKILKVVINSAYK